MAPVSRKRYYLTRSFLRRDEKAFATQMARAGLDIKVTDTDRMTVGGTPISEMRADNRNFEIEDAVGLTVWIREVV